MCTDYLIFFTSADQRDNQSSSKTDELRIDKVEIDPLGTIYSKRSTFFFTLLILVLEAVVLTIKG